MTLKLLFDVEAVCSSTANMYFSSFFETLSSINVHDAQTFGDIGTKSITPVVSPGVSTVPIPEAACDSSTGYRVTESLNNDMSPL